MRIGYARVSTDKQTTALQRDALAKLGCDEVYQDTATSGVKKRPQLTKALQRLGKGDVLVVYSFSRLGRSLVDLCSIVEQIEAKGAGFRSLTEHIDTTSAAGRLTFHVLASLAQFERELLMERTRAGLEAAKKRGVVLGRKPKLTDPKQLARARKLLNAGESASVVAGDLDVGRATLYRALARHGA